MTEYDVDFLISLIDEERPVLWDTSNEDYKNKFIKQDAWKDVCKSLFPNFEEKENNEKTKLARIFLCFVSSCRHENAIQRKSEARSTFETVSRPRYDDVRDVTLT
ncbi:hypothetical protein ACJJTC_009717 [Scirpophaga incertulas]